MVTLTKEYTLDGTGTEIDNFSASDVIDKYIVYGTAVAIGNYSISVSGTPTINHIFDFKWRGVLDISGGQTFSILGTTITANQLLYDFDATCTYNGATWDVLIERNFSSVVVETANIANDAVTNAKLAEMATMTVKANITAGTTNPSDVTISDFFGSTAWKTLGNSGLTAGTHFLGTTDNVDVVFKRDSIISGRIGATNTGFGASTLLNFTNSALDNTAIGVEALTLLISGDDNTAIGYGSLAATTTASNNTAVGAYSLNVNTVGANNTAIGLAALVNNLTGSQNTAVGLQALDNNTLGSFNTSVGVSSLLANLGGEYNTGIGETALHGNVSGVRNTGLGSNSGGVIQSGSWNTILGADADVDDSNAIHRIALGYGAIATEDFQLMTPSGINDVQFTNATVTSKGLAITGKTVDTTAQDSITINAVSGRFRKDTSGSSFVLTNSFINANSQIFLQIVTTGLTTGDRAIPVAGSGSATITFETSSSGAASAPSSNCDVNFWIVN